MTTGNRPTLGLHEKLLEIIVCPQCRGDLLPVEGGPGGEGELVCQGTCGLAYPVRGGIPVLLVDEARPAGAIPQP
ncbi:Trm112 family protein [Nocardioides cheoyonin]|uniref:Trm112 family protein n=1 Tax=Nocardioides cheoyonin TaxID=3156615 RepID=UPI0032B42698